MSDREVMQQALEFVEFLWREAALNDYAAAKREETELALRAALEQPEQGPVALCDPAEYDDFQGAVSRNQSASRQS